ncbi:IQ calmodulin-binding motif family protein [Cryptosporidium muris RN66]|uniref:IQ calmodulin-binding motif family protein n=1 Tax=Cryptosporidium muris (strain RN66) TaxID=441375 RepID=B6AAI7_CRYMR|nr:IQ calmodulin-binding motif family protein [Cryptosporidium muris RN66]EEA05228.1 IQ calmodulin-binding motif family protein [Cryptosporidium muris RN66]|eukprot:XP_002139577.1 IQ calmodulin-binding motif family protein [Cryptosporidium muris RN66]
MYNKFHLRNTRNDLQQRPPIRYNKGITQPIILSNNQFIPTLNRQIYSINGTGPCNNTLLSGESKILNNKPNYQYNGNLSNIQQNLNGIIYYSVQSGSIAYGRRPYYNSNVIYSQPSINNYTKNNPRISTLSTYKVSNNKITNKEQRVVKNTVTEPSLTRETSPISSMEYIRSSTDPNNKKSKQCNSIIEENPKYILEKPIYISNSSNLKKIILPSIEILSEIQNPTIKQTKLEYSSFGLPELYYSNGMSFKYNIQSFLMIRFQFLLHLAAIVIQCYYRRYKCMKDYKIKMLGPLNILNSSAKQIQACWRGFLTRFGGIMYQNWINCSVVRNKFTNRIIYDFKKSNCDSLNNDILNINKEKNNSSKLPNRIEYNWTLLHQKYMLSIIYNRNKSASKIQKYWRDVYIMDYEISKAILIESILSARLLAAQVINKYILGIITRKAIDKYYRITQINWPWNIHKIDSIYIISNHSYPPWKVPQKMWFDKNKQCFTYSLFLPIGTYQIAFKIIYNNNIHEDLEKYKKLIDCNQSTQISNKQNSLMLSTNIQCNSTLEIIKHPKFKFVNLIHITDKNPSTFKYLRDNICPILKRIHLKQNPNLEQVDNIDNKIDEVQENLDISKEFLIDNYTDKCILNNHNELSSQSIDFNDNFEIFTPRQLINTDEKYKTNLLQNFELNTPDSLTHTSSTMAGYTPNNIDSCKSEHYSKLLSEDDYSGDLIDILNQLFLNDDN